MSFPVNGLLDAWGFALQYEFMDSGGLSAFDMTVGFLRSLDTGYIFEIREENTCAVIEKHSAATIADGGCSLATGYNTLLVVRVDQHLAVFLNRELLCELHDLEFP